MYTNDFTDLVDLLDLLNFTLHEDFVQKWRHKYSERFITTFQYKILDSLNKGKPIKKENLSNFFKKKLRYSEEQIDNFYYSIDIGLYKPVIS